MHTTLRSVRKKSENVNAIHQAKLSWSDRLAVRMTMIVGNMWFFWACVVMVTIPIFLPAVMPVVQYISSGYLQLILLPLIMVGQNLLGRHSEEMANQHYAVSEQADSEIDEIFKHLEYQNDILEEIRDRLKIMAM